MANNNNNNNNNLTHGGEVSSQGLPGGDSV
jgi:hypothetical protein